VIRDAGSSQRTTWLYTNGRDTIRLSIVEHAAGLFRLVIAGPGHRRKATEFSDTLSIVHQQGTIEASLLAQGYCLEDFATDRRRRSDRRAFTRRTERERRLLDLL
jgi:hypothetical protein